jgi:hypothetical protein
VRSATGTLATILPAPRQLAGRPADPHRHGDVDTEPGGQHGQPPLLVAGELRGHLAPGHPHGERVAEPQGHVVPAVRHDAQGQVGKVRVLGLQESAHEVDRDVDVG